MTDLFTAPDQGQPTVDATKNYLEELVGDGKKFKTVEDLARGKAEADAFITRLSTEQQALREDLAARARLEDLIDRLSVPATGTTPPSNESNQNRELDGNTPDLAALVEQAVAKREQASRAQANISEVKNTLVASFGADYVSKLEQEATNLGVSKEFLSNLAATQPKALYRLLGLGETKTATPDVFSPPRSSLTAPTSPVATGDRTQAFYDKIKRDNPKDYWSASTQNAMHKDAMRLGERFFT